MQYTFYRIHILYIKKKNVTEHKGLEHESFFFSNFSSQSKGVANLFNNKLNLKYLKLRRIQIGTNC